jgi:hypothetical protein
VNDHNRIQLLLNHWFEIGKENGIYLKDVKYKELDGTERLKMYHLAKRHVQQSKLLPVKRKGKWVFEEVL